MPQKAKPKAPATANKPKRRGKPKGTKQVSTSPAAVEQRRDIFALEYLKDFNATRSYTVAFGKDPDGPSKKSYPPAAMRFLNEPLTQRKLADLTAAKMKQHDAGLDKVIAEIARMAFFNATDFADFDGNTPAMDLEALKKNPDAMRAIRLRFKRVIDKDGGAHDVYEMEQPDKLAALTTLLKYHTQGEDPEERARQIFINVNFPTPGANWRNKPKHVGGPEPLEDDESEAG